MSHAVPHATIVPGRWPVPHAFSLPELVASRWMGLLAPFVMHACGSQGRWPRLLCPHTVGCHVRPLAPRVKCTYGRWPCLPRGRRMLTV